MPEQEVWPSCESPCRNSAGLRGEFGVLATVKIPGHPTCSGPERHHYKGALSFRHEDLLDMSPKGSVTPAFLTATFLTRIHSSLSNCSDSGFAHGGKIRSCKWIYVGLLRRFQIWWTFTHKYAPLTSCKPSWWCWTLRKRGEPKIYNPLCWCINSSTKDVK